MHSFKSLFTNTLLGGVGMAATTGVGMVLKILLVRTLTIQDFGVLVSAQAFVGFVGFAAAVCIPDAVVWLSARDLEQTGTAGATLTTGAVLGTASGVVACLVMSLVVGLNGHASEPAGIGATVFVLALIIPFNILAETFAAGLRGVGPLWPKVIALDLGRPTLGLVAAGTLAVVGKLSLLSMTVVLVGVSVVTAVVPVTLAWRTPVTRPVWSFEAWRARALLRYGLPLLAAGVLAGPIINNGIPAILALAVSPQDVAIYAASLALQVAVYIPTAAVEQAILPHWSLTSGPSRDGFRTVTRWSLLLSSIPFAVLWLVPSDVLLLVYGGRYGGAGWLVKIAALSAFFGVSVGPNEAALRASGDTRWIFLARLIAAIAGLGTASSLMPILGALGAVLGFATASVLVNALYAIRLWLRQGVQPLSSEYVRAVAAITVALIGTLFLVAHVPDGPMVAVAVATCAYPCQLLLLLVVLRSPDPALALGGIKTLLQRSHAAQGGR